MAIFSIETIFSLFDSQLLKKMKSIVGNTIVFRIVLFMLVYLLMSIPVQTGDEHKIKGMGSTAPSHENVVF